MKPSVTLESLIHEIRGEKVIFDSDLARIYGVATRVLNQAVKRNQERVPEDFMFSLTRDEIKSMSQSVISLARLKFSKEVRAFTEHGALMAANVLNSAEAVKMSVHIVRAFIKQRELIASQAEILNAGYFRTIDDSRRISGIGGDKFFDLRRSFSTVHRERFAAFKINTEFSEDMIEETCKSKSLGFCVGSSFCNKNGGRVAILVPHKIRGTVTIAFLAAKDVETRVL